MGGRDGGWTGVGRVAMGATSSSLPAASSLEVHPAARLRGGGAAGPRARFVERGAGNHASNEAHHGKLPSGSPLLGHDGYAWESMPGHRCQRCEGSPVRGYRARVLQPVVMVAQWISSAMLTLSGAAAARAGGAIAAWASPCGLSAAEPLLEALWAALLRAAPLRAPRAVCLGRRRCCLHVALLALRGRLQLMMNDDLEAMGSPLIFDLENVWPLG